MRATENKKMRKPLKKLIAIWVVFAMLIVPLANHFQGIDDAKADGVGVKIVTDSSVETTVSMDVSIEVDPDTGNPIANSAEKTISQVSGVQTVTKLQVNLLKDNDGVELGYGIGELAYGAPRTTSETLVPLAKNATVIDLGENKISSGDKVIAIYAKSSTSDWVRQSAVNVKFFDHVFENPVCLADANDQTYPDGSYTDRAKLLARINPGIQGNAAGLTLNYYVKVGQPATDEELKNVANYNISVFDSEISVTPENRGKEVYGYAALLTGSGDTAQILEYAVLGHVHMSNDAKAPEIHCEDANVSYWDPAANAYAPIQARFIDTEQNLYYGVSAKYRYMVSVKDSAAEEQDASGVKSVTAKLETTGDALTVTAPAAGSDLYGIEITDAQAAGDTVLVTATDNKGNSQTYRCPIKISQAVEGTEVKGVTFADDASWDGLTTGKKLPHQTAKKQIKVTLDSSHEIQNIVLTNGDKTWHADENSLIVTEPSVKRVYTVTATFSIPEDLETSETLAGLEIKAYDGNNDAIAITGNTKIQTILYDAKAPQIQDLKIQKSEDNGVTWSEVGEADSTYDPIITELDSIYRYVVTVTDAEGESGVKSVYVDEANALTPLGSGKYALAIPEDALRTDIPYTKTIYASDQAGNISSGTALRGVRLIDKTLRVETAVIKDSAGNDVTTEIAAGKKFTNKQFTLEISASSAYAITNISVTANGYTDSRDGAALSGNQKDATTHRYTATATFALPKDSDVNALLEQLYATIADGHNAQIRYPETDGVYLGSILYDRTVPTLTVNEADGNVWYQNYTMNYTIRSGEANVESPLASAGYVMNGFAGGESNEAIALDGTQETVSGEIAIPESSDVTGTNIAFEAKDASENQMPSYGYSVKVDKTRPDVDLRVDGKKILSNPLEGDVNIAATVSDNLTIGKATITVKGPGTDVTKTLCQAAEQANIKQTNTMLLNTLIEKTAADGDYTITVNVEDKAGNASEQTVSFRVDNTVPVVTAKISGGETAGKRPGQNFDGTVCDYYYRSNVSVLLTYEDTNISANDVTVTDNNNKVRVSWTRIGDTNKYEANYVITASGGHTIRIEAKDLAGNAAASKQIMFIKDTEAPVVSAVINGGIFYTESMGQLDMTANTSVAFSVSELNGDDNDFNYQLIKTLPDQLPVTADVLKTDNRVFSYTDEAEYEIKAYAIDMAGNRSAERTVRFRLDKTAPELKITGAASGSSLSSGTTLTFSMTEAFWRDASGTITITRKSGDGASESTYKTIDFKPTARTTTLTETLSETGEYSVKFTAKDRAGHTAEASNYTVKIDTNKPIITLSGVKNNDKTTDQVEFQAQIEEDFYLTKSVNIQATRTYLDPKTYQEKTEDIKFTGYNPTAATTLIRNTFTEDGIYKIQLTCKDAAGNEDSQEVSFTIDKTNPVIDPEVLGAYEGKLTSFAWDYDLNDVVYDLTVCDVHMYLNGSEYDGTSEVEDGAYEMLIVAEDELGNKTEETANFTLDTKAPTFIVTGVEDGEVKNEPYTIHVSLQLEEDTLDSVELDGKSIDITDNQADLTVSEKGDYELTMKAHDDAGNQTEKTISFRYGQKKTTWLFIIIGIAGVILIGGAVFIIVKRKKK